MRPFWPPILSLFLGGGLALWAIVRPSAGPHWPPLGWAMLGLVGAFLIVVGADAWRHRLAQAKLLGPSASPEAPPFQSEGT